MGVFGRTMTHIVINGTYDAEIIFKLTPPLDIKEGTILPADVIQCLGESNIKFAWLSFHCMRLWNTFAGANDISPTIWYISADDGTTWDSVGDGFPDTSYIMTGVTSIQTPFDYAGALIDVSPWVRAAVSAGQRLKIKFTAEATHDTVHAYGYRFDLHLITI